MGIAVSLIGHFPGSVLSVKEGRLETALSDQGEDMLPVKEWDRKINFPRLSTDKTKVVFEVKMKGLGPESKARGLKELSGVIDYQVGGDLAPVDLGFTSLKAGTKGDQFNAEIIKVGKNTWDEKKQDLELRLNIDHGAIQSTEFLDAAGKPLEVERSSSSYGSETTTLTFSIKGTFPETGKIKITVYKTLQKFRASFKLENIGFSGHVLE